MLSGWARGREVVALTGDEPLARWLGVESLQMPPGLELVDAGSLATAARLALQAGAGWLALPLAAHHDGEPPLALRLAELEAALAAWGLPRLEAPLLRRGWRELGRLALAYEVPFELTRDCATGCNSCATCKGRAQALSAAGMPR